MPALGEEVAVLARLAPFGVGAGSGVAVGVGVWAGGGGLGAGCFGGVLSPPGGRRGGELVLVGVCRGSRARSSRRVFGAARRLVCCMVSGSFSVFVAWPYVGGLGWDRGGGYSVRWGSHGCLSVRGGFMEEVKGARLCGPICAVSCRPLLQSRRWVLPLHGRWRGGWGAWLQAEVEDSRW